MEKTKKFKIETDFSDKTLKLEIPPFDDLRATKAVSFYSKEFDHKIVNFRKKHHCYNNPKILHSKNDQVIFIISPYKITVCEDWNLNFFEEIFLKNFFKKVFEFQKFEDRYDLFEITIPEDFEKLEAIYNHERKILTICLRGQFFLKFHFFNKKKLKFLKGYYCYQGIFLDDFNYSLFEFEVRENEKNQKCFGRTFLPLVYSKENFLIKKYSRAFLQSNDPEIEISGFRDEKFEILKQRNIFSIADFFAVNYQFAIFEPGNSLPLKPNTVFTIFSNPEKNFLSLNIVKFDQKNMKILRNTNKIFQEKRIKELKLGPNMKLLDIYDEEQDAILINNKKGLILRIKNVSCTDSEKIKIQSFKIKADHVVKSIKNYYVTFGSRLINYFNKKNLILEIQKPLKISTEKYISRFVNYFEIENKELDILASYTNLVMINPKKGKIIKDISYRISRNSYHGVYIQNQFFVNFSRISHVSDEVLEDYVVDIAIHENVFDELEFQSKEKKCVEKIYYKNVKKISFENFVLVYSFNLKKFDDVMTRIQEYEVDEVEAYLDPKKNEFNLVYITSNWKFHYLKIDYKTKKLKFKRDFFLSSQSKMKIDPFTTEIIFNSEREYFLVKGRDFISIWDKEMRKELVGLTEKFTMVNKTSDGNPQKISYYPVLFDEKKEELLIFNQKGNNKNGYITCKIYKIVHDFEKEKKMKKKIKVLIQNSKKKKHTGSKKNRRKKKQKNKKKKIGVLERYEEDKAKTEDMSELESLNLELKNCFKFKFVKKIYIPNSEEIYDFRTRSPHISSVMMSPDGERIFIFPRKNENHKLVVEIFNRDFEGLYKLEINNVNSWSDVIRSSNIHYKCTVLGKNFLLLGTRMRVLVDLRKIEKILKLNEKNFDEINKENNKIFYYNEDFRLNEFCYSVKIGKENERVNDFRFNTTRPNYVNIEAQNTNHCGKTRISIEELVKNLERKIDEKNFDNVFFNAKGLKHSDFDGGNIYEEDLEDSGEEGWGDSDEDF